MELKFGERLLLTPLFSLSERSSAMPGELPDGEDVLPAAHRRASLAACPAARSGLLAMTFPLADCLTELEVPASLVPPVRAEL